ncbi:MAG: hypothetical protein SO053_07260 [Bifidobacterium animalis]|nr:type II toxin-antitoxin system YafQ family toxin [Bifidobacterium animalis]MDY5040929.1 hypothetical protein [Bifidobacterium animalis]
MARLSADFSTAFSRDLKKKARKRQWGLSKLKEVIELVIENSPASIAALKQRHIVDMSSQGRYGL